MPTRRTNLGGRLWRVNGWVLTRVDGTRTIRIRLRPEDIEGAECRNPNCCAVCRAIERHELSQGRPCKAVVWATIIMVIPLGRDGVTPTGTAVRYVLSRETRAFIRHFDETGVYPPGVVAELFPPSPSHQLGGRSKARGVKADGTPHVRRATEVTLPTRGRCEPALEPAPSA